MNLSLLGVKFWPFWTWKIKIKSPQSSRKPRLWFYGVKDGGLFSFCKKLLGNGYDWNVWHCSLSFFLLGIKGLKDLLILIYLPLLFKAFYPLCSFTNSRGSFLSSSGKLKMGMLWSSLVWCMLWGEVWHSCKTACSLCGTLSSDSVNLPQFYACLS